MREKDAAAVESIKKIAEQMTTPAPAPTEEEKIEAAKKIAEEIHEPIEGGPESFEVGSVPRPPDGSNIDERHGRSAGKKKTKKERREMAEEKRKHQKKGGPEHGREAETGSPGRAEEPVPPGTGKRKEPEPEPEPENDWRPLI